MQYTRWQGPDRPVPNGGTVTRLELETNADAPRIARTALESLRGQIDDDVLERSMLLTSEVVTNAVRFSGGSQVRVDLWRSGTTLAVVASDDGPGFDPVPLRGTIADALVDGGFGLPLLDTLSDRWGSGTAADSWVWFEVSPRLDSQPARAPETDGDQLLDIRMVVESVRNHALIALDLKGNVTNWGAGPVALTGYTADEMLGRPLCELYVPSSSARFARDSDAALAEGWHATERWISRKDRPMLWVEVALAPIRDRSGTDRALSALISDITARKREGEEREQLIADLREQTLTDELTGLPNRRHLADELARELARSRRNGTEFAVAMIDLDGFKAFNDEHGHAAGDDLLRTVTRKWSAALRGSDLLGRLGGDEFAVTLPDCSPELALVAIARIQDSAETLIGSSAGIASSRAADTGEDLLARADAALYSAKRSGRRVSTDGAVSEAARERPQP
jgi:diguanylate cyclase (GGDEF)-like protein/PAS domain S-box-containing protein